MKKRIDDLRLITKCCFLYYENELTQGEIAETLNLSRPTVSRLLKEAKALGVVKIIINNDFYTNFNKLEQEAERRLGLREVILVEDHKDPANQKMLVAKAAASYLERVLKDGDIVGVSMGTTLAEISKFANKTRADDLTFIPMVGGVGQLGIEIHPNQLVRDMGVAFGGKFIFLHAPAILSNSDIKKALLEEDSIKHVMDMMKRISYAVVGIGIPNENSTMRETGYYDDQMLQEIVSRSAVGDICLQSYTIEGKSDAFEMNRNVLGTELKDLKKIPNVIGVACGEEKAAGIIGAIQGKFIRTLITNVSCCRKILSMQEEMDRD